MSTNQSPSPQDLAAKIAAKRAETEGTGSETTKTQTLATQPPVKNPSIPPETTGPEIENQKTGAVINGAERVFQFLMTPCTIPMRCKRKQGRGRIHCPDGTYKTSDPDEIAELEQKVNAHLCFDITGNKPLHGRYQSVPEKSASQIFAEQQ